MTDGEGSDSEDEPQQAIPAVQPEVPPAEGMAEPAEPDKLDKPPAVITVLADCTEEGSPRDPLAVIQIPQQREADTPEACTATDQPASKESTALEDQAALVSSEAAEQAGMPETHTLDGAEQPAAEPELLNSAEAAQATPPDGEQQTAGEHDESMAADYGTCHASAAAHAGPGDPIAEALLCPKRERRPTSKAAELPPGSPGSQNRPASPAQSAPALRKRAPRPKRAWKEGTYLGSGLWLMCYCSRHKGALEQMGAARAIVSLTTGQGFQDALSLQPKARQTPTRPQRAPAAQPFWVASGEECLEGALRPTACNSLHMRHDAASARRLSPCMLPSARAH